MSSYLLLFFNLPIRSIELLLGAMPEKGRKPSISEDIESTRNEVSQYSYYEKTHVTLLF